MLSLDLLNTFYAYQRWTTQRILDTAENLTPEQFTAKVGASFDSVRDTLVHVMIVERNWIHRCREVPMPRQAEFQEFPTLASIRQAWAGIEADTQAYLATIDEAMLSYVVEYINSQGQQSAYPIWQMLLHQANHAQQHRSEVAVMLTQFGHSPNGLDLLVYLETLKK